MTPEQFIEKILTPFKTEISYYIHPDVQTTAQQVGTPFKDGWLDIMRKMDIIKYSQSINITELKRTLSALYCFQLSMTENTYATFTAAQNTLPDKLSSDNYNTLCSNVKSTLNNNKEAKEVLVCLIIYSDLGKSPVTRKLAESAGVDPTLDTDDLMLEILKLDDAKVTDILPSFGSLSTSARSMLRSAYPIMTACFGHLYFLEAGPKTLETIAKALQDIEITKRQELLELVFWAQFYDAVGGQGHLNMAGSVTCTNNFYKSYMLMRSILHDFEAMLTATDNVEKSVTESLEPYLLERAKWLALNANSLPRADFEFILRLACTLRIFDARNAAYLIEAFYKLDPTYQILLTDQLNLTSKKGLNLFARTPHYVATFAHNISRVDFNNDNIHQAIDKALQAEICLALLIKEITEKYREALNNAKMPISFGKLAFRAPEPGFCIPQEFDATLARWALPRPQPSSSIKNLIFDLGNVFIKIDTSRITVFRAFSQLAKKHGKNMSTAEVGLIFNEKDTDELILAYHCGKIATTEFRHQMREKLGLENISNEEFDQAFSASILASPEEVKQRLEYLDDLINQGYNTYSLSDNIAIHRNYLKQNYDADHWGKYFFKQYYSNETGLKKPKREAYYQILQENQLKPEETLFFDDILKHVDAAWEYNIRARQFSVKRPMADIKLIIDTITRNAQLNTEVSRISTLSLFAAAKFKKIHHSRKLKSEVSSMRLN